MALMSETWCLCQRARLKFYENYIISENFNPSFEDGMLLCEQCGIAWEANLPVENKTDWRYMYAVHDQSGKPIDLIKDEQVLEKWKSENPTKLEVFKYEIKKIIHE